MQITCTHTNPRRKTEGLVDGYGETSIAKENFSPSMLLRFVVSGHIQ